MEKQEISDAPVTRSFQPDPEHDDVGIHRWPYPISSPFRFRSLISPRRGWLSLESFHESLRAPFFFFFFITLSNEVCRNFFSCFSTTFFSIYYFSSSVENDNCQFRRFDAIAVSILGVYREDLLVRLCINNDAWFLFSVSFFLKENC